MDIWIKYARRRGLNGMNRPDAGAVALDRIEEAVAALCRDLLEQPGAPGFGILAFRDVSDESVERLIREIDYIDVIKNLITFYFETDADKAAWSERMILRHHLSPRGLRLVTSADIDRRRERRAQAVDEFTEAAENALLTPSHPERDA